MARKTKNQAKLPTGLVTLMFTDIVDSSRLKGLIDGETSRRRDEAYKNLIKDPHDKIINEHVKKSGGQIVNRTGDGFCFVFSDAEEAVMCGLEIQKKLSNRAIETPLGTLKIRIGLHSGSVQLSLDGYTSTAMDMAARVQSKAEPGQVVISPESFALVRGKIRTVDFETLGEFDLKGFEGAELWQAFYKDQNPSVLAEERYCEHVLQRFGKLTLYSVTSDKPLAVDLEQVFVRLNAIRLDREQEKKITKGTFSKVLNINETLSAANHTVIMGPPGSGKTTLLKFIALSFARRQAFNRLSLNEDRIPFLVPLRELNRFLDNINKKGDLQELSPNLLVDYLENHFKTYSELRLTKSFFTRVFEKKKGIILFDGLDEISDRSKRIRMAQLIGISIQMWSESRFIITSRPRGYDNESRQHLPPSCTEMMVRDFDNDDIKAFVKNWYKAVTTDREGDTPTSRSHAKESAVSLLSAIESERVRPLASNPLLLSILALVHQRGIGLPQRRVTLYEECCEFLLGYWDQVRGGETGRELAEIGGMSRKEKLHLLEPIALWLHMRGEESGEVTAAELETQLAIQFRKLFADSNHQAAKRAKEFLSIVTDRTGLLVERENGVFAFAHLTFQEYLAARALADNDNLLSMTQTYMGDPWWHEVILLTVAHLSTPCTQRSRVLTKSLLDAIARHRFFVGKKKSQSGLLFAFRCLCDVEKLGISEEYRRNIVKRIVRLWSNYHANAEGLQGVWVEAHFEGLLTNPLWMSVYEASDITQVIILFAYALPTEAGAELLKKLRAEIKNRPLNTQENITNWLLALLLDSNPKIRLSAIEVLGALGAESSTPALIFELKRLEKSNDANIAKRTKEILIKIEQASDLSKQ